MMNKKFSNLLNMDYLYIRKDKYIFKFKMNKHNHKYNKFNNFKGQEKKTERD